VAARGTGLDVRKSDDFAAGVAANTASTVYHGGDLLRRVGRMAGIESDRLLDSPDVRAAITPPDSPHGRAGAMVGQAAEMAVPVARVMKATRALPWFTRTMAEAGTAGAVAGVQTGGDPSAVIANTGLGALLPATTAGVRAGVRTARNAAAGAREGGVGGALASAVRATAPAEPKVMLVQALKPRATNARFEPDLDLAMPELKVTEAALGRPIASVDDLLEATKVAKQRVRAQYDQMAGPRRAMGTQVDLSSVAEAMERSIPKKLQLENPEAALRLKQAAGVYRERFSLEDAEQLLKETNAEMEAFYSKYPPAQRRALAADPEYARLNAQAVALRDAIYSTLDAEGGGAAARELQRRYGALLDVEMETYRRANVAKRQQPESLSEQIGRVRAAADAARGAFKMLRGDLVGGGADLVAAGAGRDTARFLKEQQTADALIRRAFQGYRGTPTPVAMPSHAPVRGLLGPGPIVTPPPADRSFVRGVRAQPAMSERPALPPGRAPVVTPPPEDRSFVRGVRGEYARRQPRAFLPEARRESIPLPGVVEPDVSRVRSVPAAPIAYDMNPTVGVKAGGFRVAQYSGDPAAARAAVAKPEVRSMLERMRDDLDEFAPERGRIIRDPNDFDSGQGIYSPGTAGSPVGDDVRVISEQNVSNRDIRQAVQDLLDGKMPTNRLHTAALDAAEGYLEQRPGYRGPTMPAGWKDAELVEDDGFDAFSRAVDELSDEP